MASIALLALASSGKVTKPAVEEEREDQCGGPQRRETAQRAGWRGGDAPKPRLRPVSRSMTMRASCAPNSPKVCVRRAGGYDGGQRTRMRVALRGVSRHSARHAFTTRAASAAAQRVATHIEQRIVVQRPAEVGHCTRRGRERERAAGVGAVAAAGSAARAGGMTARTRRASAAPRRPRKSRTIELVRRRHRLLLRGAAVHFGRGWRSVFPSLRY